MKVLTQERLKQLLHYDRGTGIFTWLVAPIKGGVKAGDVAGTLPDPYVHIGIEGILYRAHRLAWLYVHGYFPEHGLDHKDRIKHHNWIDNLRITTNQCNIRNSGLRKDNKSGVKGVSWHKSSIKWRASVKVCGTVYGQGYHKDFTEAVAHRLAAEQCLGWANCDSSSPAFLYMQEYLK